jgi:hypothetical protein
MLMSSQALAAAVAIPLAVLTLTGRVELWHVLVGVSVLGVADAVHWTSRNALTYDLVGPGTVLNAMAVNYLAFNMLRVISALAGGFLIASVGTGGAFSLAAMSNLLAMALLSRLRTPPVAIRRRDPLLTTVWEGLRFAMKPGPHRSLLLLSLIGEVFGYSHMVMLPVMARDVLGVGATGLGYLWAAAGVGGFLANLALASQGDIRAKGWLLMGGTAGYGLFLMLFAVSPWFGLALLFIGVAAASAVTYDVTLSALLHMAVPDQVRGRVMGIYSMTWGFMPMGGFQAGAIAGVLGAPFAIGIGGAVLLLAGLRTLPLVRRFNSQAAG